MDIFIPEHIFHASGLSGWFDKIQTGSTGRRELKRLRPGI